VPQGLAQAGNRIRRVGIAFSSDPQTSRPYLDALVRGLEARGYRLDRDCVVEVRYAQGRPERYPAIIGELLAAGADVIVVGANSSVLAAKAATSALPIVMAGSLDPDVAGLVASLARPGGNVTGVSSMSADITAKRLQLLHELLPAASRVAYLTNPAVPGWERVTRDVESAGGKMALRVATVTASTPEEVDRALASLLGQRPDALLVGNALLFWTHRRRVIDFCAQHRVPASYAYGQAVREGGLTSYAADLEDTFRLAGGYVARILGGAKPADLPVEQPTRYELLINARTATALGIAIPDVLRARADVVD